MKRLIDRVRNLRRKTISPNEPSISKANPAKNINCTEFEVDGWGLSDFVLAKLVPVVGAHPFPLQELMLMAGAVCRYRPPMIFEWGTHIGKSARVFYETIRHYGISSSIHSIDLPDEAVHVEHPKHERGRLVRGLPGITLHQGDGVSTALQLWADNGRPDYCLFFVDGDHAYESVKRELQLITTSVPKPVILAHDTFYQSAASGYNIGPHQAAAELLSAAPQALRVVHSGISLPGMTLIAPN